MELKTPYADWLPPLSTAEFEALRASVEAEGVKHPVDITEDGRVLDGHYRLKVKADAPLCVIPGTQEWSDDECRAYMFRTNFRRRNLSPEQRKEQLKAAREAALRLKSLDGERYTQEVIAGMFGVCQRTISHWLEKISNVANLFQPSDSEIPDSRVKVPKTHWPIIVERIENGETASQVAADYGVTKQLVNHVVRKYRKRQERKDTSVPPEGSPEIVDDLQKLIDRGLTYGCVYADPPWDYDNQGTRAATGDHYGTMPVEEIAALPIAQLARPEAHLFLWTTWAFIFECPRIIEAWGFEYKTGAIWCKPQIGIGNYFRKSTEILLVASRGGLQFEDPKPERDWFVHDRLTHSQKPQMFRQIIERVGTGPFLELFGRQPADGWTVFGNQVELGMFDNDVIRV